MKKFDRYSIRGIIFSTLGVAGIVYEVFYRSREVFVIVLYGVVVLIGGLLIFRIREHQD